MVAVWLMSASVGAALAACGSSSFTCSSDAQCMENGVAGFCHDSGFCSFSDDDCESEQRFGSHAGDGLAGQCVPPPGGTDPTTDPTTASSSPDTDTSATLPTTTATDSDSTSTTSPVASTSTASSTTVSDTTETTSSTGPSTGSSSSDGSSTGPIVDSDLVLWYRFEDSLGDGPQDSSNSSLHGTCTACPTSAPGKFGDAAYFDGSTQFIETPLDESLELDEFTVSLWAHKESWLDGSEHITGRAFGSDNYNSWELYTTTDGTSTALRAFIGDASGVGEFGGVSVSQAVDEWIHVAYVWNGTNAIVYANGQLALDLESPGPIVYDDHPVRIGADIDFEENNNFYQGRIDDYRIYDRALTFDEIAEIAAR